jgi:hypothetical protein
MEMLKVYGVALSSLLAGAAVVHAVLQPDVRLPVESSSTSGQSGDSAPQPPQRPAASSAAGSKQ